MKIDNLPVSHVPHLPESPTRREDWPRYERELLEHRVQVLWETSIDCPDYEYYRAREIERVARDGRYWLATYCAIYEARPDEEADLDPETEALLDTQRSEVIPFIPYPFQYQVWDWFEALMRTRGAKGDGLIAKARDMGLSNMACAFAAHGWMTKKPFQVRLLSRVERLVDAAGDPDSLFWKVELLLKSQPSWLMAAFAPGFDWRKHRQVMKLINPSNMNVISGESTQANAGRGGRASLIIYDEAAFMPNFGAIWTAGRASTRHRVAISTVSVDEGLDFQNLHKGTGGYEQPSVLEIPYYVHPLHDEAWLNLEMSRDTEEGIRREIFMDYKAGTGNWVYPMTHDVEVGTHPFKPYGGPIYVALDDGFRDDWSINWIQYDIRTGRHRILEAYQNKGKVVDFYGTIMTGIPRSDFSYTPDEIALMEWVRQLPGCTYIGDTHGAQVEQVSGESVFDRLGREFNIWVYYDNEKGRRTRDRRNALGAILQLMDFNDTEGVAYTLSCLQNARFRPQKTGEITTYEPKEPIHDWTSHARSALEYYAVMFSQIQALGPGGNKIRYSGESHS